MSNKRFFYVMVGIIGFLGILVIGTTFFGNSLLQKESKALVDLKLEDRLLEEQQLALTQANKDLEKYTELDAIARTIVPQDKDQARAVREIVQIAAESNIKLANITFPASNLGQTATPKPTTTTPTEGDAAATAAPTTPPVTQVKPVSGIPGVYVMELNIQSDTTTPVPYSRFIEFLERLGQNRRTAQVSTITIQPSTEDRNRLTFTLALNLYIKP